MKKLNKNKYNWMKIIKLDFAIILTTIIYFYCLLNITYYISNVKKIQVNYKYLNYKRINK